MQPKTWIVGFAVALACSSGAASAQSNGSWDIVLNGRSHHVDAAYQWNEDNYGLGFEREFASASPWIKVALGNTFMDSMNNPSYMAGRRPQAALSVGLATTSTSISAASRS